MTSFKEIERGVQIEIHKWYWFNELATGTSMDVLDIELLICEEEEDYEQCEGIRLAKLKYLKSKQNNERT